MQAASGGVHSDLIDYVIRTLLRSLRPYREFSNLTDILAYCLLTFLVQAARPSLRDDDVKAQGKLPAPREINVGVWIVVAVIIALLDWII